MGALFGLYICKRCPFRLFVFACFMVALCALGFCLLCVNYSIMCFVFSGIYSDRLGCYVTFCFTFWVVGLMWLGFAARCLHVDGSV